MKANAGMAGRLAIVASVVLFASALPALAHPGVGIVIAREGDVFYTDLAQVWRIKPNGAREIAAPNVHTHELYLDDDGALFGEHLWYEGKATDKWGHRVWQRKTDGSIVTVIPATEGFLTNYSFVRDASGTMYWAEHGTRTVIMKRRPPAAAAVYARGAFRDVRWMTASRDGLVYLIDDGDLVRIQRDGRVETVVKDLRETTLLRALMGDRHALMGLWLDRAGNVYVAAHDARAVEKVTPNGAVSVLLRTPSPWSPTGGTFAPNGDLWLLESGTANQVRARRIPRSALAP